MLNTFQECLLIYCLLGKRRQVKVIFEAEESKIFDMGGELLATAEVYKDLYKLNCGVNFENCVSTLIGSNDFELWHRRLGHICDSNLVKGKQTRKIVV